MAVLGGCNGNIIVENLSLTYKNPDFRISTVRLGYLRNWRESKAKMSRSGVKAAMEVGLEESESGRKLKSLERGLRFDVVSECELKEKGFLGMRKTKMVCTIGPSCYEIEDLERLALGGMNVARFNMCHNSRDWHRDSIRKIKKLNEEKGFCVSVMIDTEGSQIHVVDHGSPSSIKAEDGSIWLFTARKHESSSPFTIDTNYEAFSEGILVGDELVIDGGMASFEVIEKDGSDLRCKCTDPGLFLPRAKFSFWRDGKLVNRNYELPTLNKVLGLQDWDDIEFGVAEGVDFIAVSFVNKADSIMDLKKYLSSNSAESVRVLAKIESLESLYKLEEITEAADGIMVARGDLGVEIPLEQIPIVQAEIIKICRKLNKPVIVASQLLESMVEYPTPTRAEVADVSEAVQQFADALMLSGESAIGSYGEKALSVLCMASSRMEMWSRVENRQSALDQHQIGVSLPDRIAEQICSSATTMANKLAVDAIFVYTKHGRMAALLSGNRPNPPIFAFTNNESTKMALNLFWGVTAIQVDLSYDYLEANVSKDIEIIKSKGLIKSRDSVLVVFDVDATRSSPMAFQSIQVKIVN